jgi:C4-dicarboxylate-specific signal transduction histidine kinase
LHKRAPLERKLKTQPTVMQHERLLALGQMASGIAHRINNDCRRFPGV